MRICTNLPQQEVRKNYSISCSAAHCLILSYSRNILVDMPGANIEAVLIKIGLPEFTELLLDAEVNMSWQFLNLT